MGSFEKMGRELMQGDKATKMNKIVNSAEGQKIGKMVDGKELKNAMLKGDKDTMSRILSQVMETDEGKTLVKRISESFGK